MTVFELALVVLQVILFLAVGWSVSSLAISRFLSERDLGWPERSLFAIGGGCVFATALMLGHIVTGGAVFSNPFVVPLFGIASMAAALLSGSLRASFPRNALVAVALLLALFVVPMFIAGSTVREGDPPWHMGWTHELLDGQPLPDGHAPEFSRNAYPWGWHGIIATTTRLVPGANPLLSHEALHLVLVLGIPLAAACLARRVRADAGWYAAGAASLIAGFGWISALKSDFIATPTEARYGADMVVASPNSVYELFPPALPREMGLVLLGLVGTLLLFAIRERRASWWYAAGLMAGCAGLVSFPMLIPSLLWGTVCALFARGERVRAWLRVVVPAMALFALWLGPLVYWYLTQGGFVDVVPVLGVEWSLGVALAAWGLLLPLAAWGAVLLTRSLDVQTKVLLGFAATSVALILIAVLRRELSWGLEGNQTLLHQGRMWPVAHLLGAAFAGVALAHLVALLARRSRLLSWVAIGTTFVLGSISLLLSIPALTELIDDREKGFVYGDEDLMKGSFVREAAEHLSPGDVLSAEDDGLAFKLFEFSGVSLAEYDDPRLEGNEARIRYRDLAGHYVERIDSGGFAPTHAVVDAGASVEGEVLETGEYEGREWALVILPEQDR